MYYFGYLFSCNSFLKDGATKREMEIICKVNEHNNDFRRFINSLVEEGVFHIVGYTDNKNPFISSTKIKIVKKLRKIEFYKEIIYPMVKFDTESF